MGSLMAGWNSPVQDPKYVKEMRNKSLTKERIEEYWRLKKQIEEEHLKAIITSPPYYTYYKMGFGEEYAKEPTRWRSLPLLVGKEEENDQFDLDDLRRNCWWTRSNWAFLNEPPVMDEVPKYNYVSQYDVATLATTTPDTRIASI